MGPGWRRNVMNDSHCGRGLGQGLANYGPRAKSVSLSIFAWPMSWVFLFFLQLAMF